MERQISAHISSSTKEELERFAEEHGLKKDHLIEEALQHHLRALREIPRDVIVPARIVVSRKSGDAVLKRIGRARDPTAATRMLFAKRRR